MKHTVNKWLAALLCCALLLGGMAVADDGAQVASAPVDGAVPETAVALGEAPQAETAMSNDVASAPVDAPVPEQDFELDPASPQWVDEQGRAWRTFVDGGVETIAMVDGGTDNEALFGGYLYREIGYSAPGVVVAPKRTFDCGSRLTGLNAGVYAFLRSKIIRVAAGELENTEFSTAWSDMGIQSSYTFAELGASDAEGAIQALYDSYNMRLIMQALMADCPYELYWFDKTRGMRTSGFSYSYDSTTVYVSGNFSCSMSVAKAYSVDQTQGTYRFDTTIGQSVQGTAAAAKAVVRANRSKGLYDKLVAYRDWICANVDYNDDAASGNVPYGDPWQLIYIFDGDPATKVVCEGYSKGFQYLCDLSDLGDACCYCVSGKMGRTGSTNGGAHMWNVVRMDDAKNYLVDVTNSDSGTIGSDGSLFLRGWSSYDSGRYTYGWVWFSYNEETTGLYSAIDLELCGTDYAGSPVTPPTPTPPPTDGPTAPPYVDPTPGPSDDPGTPTPPPGPGEDGIDIADCEIDSIRNQVYTGKAKKPQPEIYYNDEMLFKGVDYKLSYKNNTAIGKATVIITGIGDYCGTVKRTFKIVPKAVTLKSLTAGSKRLTVKWKKGSNITGYEIQYGLKKNFSSAKKTTAPKNATLRTLKNLKSKKTYYVRIRAYKKVGSTKYYSAWSKTLSKRTK